MKLFILYLIIGISIFLLAQNYDESKENKKNDKANDNTNRLDLKNKKQSSQKAINNDKKRYSKEGIKEYQRIMNFKKEKDAQKVQSDYICYDSYGQKFTDKDPGFVQCLKELEKKEKHDRVMPNGSGAGGRMKIKLGE